MRFVLGVDEAGRGPLAGPVAVGAVFAPERFKIAREFPGIADSKQLTPLARERIYALLVARARAGDLTFAVRFASAGAIDSLGLTRAILRATASAVRALAPETEGVRVYLDGLLHAPEEYAQQTIIGGDEALPIISLASIAAKVARDRLMLRLAKRYPAYGFERHKGYGTALHYEALEKHGPCAIHRASFLHPSR